MIEFVEEPAKKSIGAVFDTVNKRTEALDILNKYKDANNQLVRSSVENVQILGMSEPVKLTDIYSTTRISTSIHRRLYSTEWAELDSLEWHKKNGKHKSTIRADEYIEKHDRIVVLAGPGSGKTTLLKYTALSYVDKELFSKSKLETKKVPFFLSLPDIVETESNIEEYLSNKLKIKTHEYASEYVRRQLDKGRAAVLLDSLDEVPQAKRKRAYDLIEEFSDLYPNAKIIITCRVADYDVTLEGFYEVEISRLTEAAINKIIKAWFKGRPKKSRELINHLSVDKDVYSLTETPLLLSLLCIQYSNDLNIPNRKTELYSRCIDALLRLWDTSRGFRRDTIFSSLTDDRKEKLFAEVAYQFICNRNETYIFQNNDLNEIISKFIERFGLNGNDSQNIIDEIESHHGVLEKYSAESYSFSHVSFQEYFVAAALVAKRQELSFVKRNVNKSKASSIIVFMVSLMEDPSPILKFLMTKSTLKGIKTYPAMSSRTEVLSLLYRCMNSGVAICPTLRDSIYTHIARSQIDISKIYRDASTYPIAKLENDGVSHTFFYTETTRKTLGAALLSYRKLSNEILLSPNKRYAEAAIKVIDEYEMGNNNIVTLCVKTCVLVPLSGSVPENVLVRLEALGEKLNKDDLLRRLVEVNTDKLKNVYIDASE
ncbi:NACHT domain-containing protein [Grimontia sp. NTOU-MAR1]|uniref:NACHT domain-containing protein n=1 Tax=Grimontia sp. NTOU-MAR1 TaxID=3111011 RepID=UPI002DBF65F5|nr:NACHT domain-containing protein [Grimontia sp. NTOU-MAR1]WRV96532.1 NACHT domain-containing protein [Grimontia sp. NTOU-MAR1]